jgi:RimJ/RimL family protein N-acetyltransferase
MSCRVLVPGDEGELFRFLEPYTDTSLFFYSNIERGGLRDTGEAPTGSYVGHFDATGALTAVACHAWNGVVMVQGDLGLESAAAETVRVTGREVRGFIGPWSLACRARRALGLDQKKAVHDGREVLLTLPLAQLRLPELLTCPGIEFRVPTPAEVEGVLLEWRIAYEVETLGATRDAALEARARSWMSSWLAGGTIWVLTHDGALVSLTGFNSVARGIVQVGGVYTPPDLRSRGYARAAVGASLAAARSQGATRSILFTSEQNIAAQRAYQALGYEASADLGLILF